jgi:hypothetical protein
MPYKDPLKQKQAQHEHFLRNRAKFAKRRNDRRCGLRIWVSELKEGKPCSDCNIEWPYYCLEFHHLKPENKVMSISAMVSNCKNRELILQEIKKCILLCSNCHRIREHSGEIY